jgi:hypothetical protein
MWTAYPLPPAAILTDEVVDTGAPVTPSFSASSFIESLSSDSFVDLNTPLLNSMSVSSISHKIDALVFNSFTILWAAKYAA